MTLVPFSYDLFSDLDRHFGNLLTSGRVPSNVSNREKAEWLPAVDIKEEETKYVVIADVPGVDPKDIEISFENGVLSIRGHREAQKSEEKDGFKRVERVYGEFCRELVLPNTVDATNITACGKNGVLEVQIPKQEKAKPIKIAVN